VSRLRGSHRDLAADPAGVCAGVCWLCGSLLALAVSHRLVLKDPSALAISPTKPNPLPPLWFLFVFLEPWSRTLRRKGLCKSKTYECPKIIYNLNVRQEETKGFIQVEVKDAATGR